MLTRADPYILKAETLAPEPVTSAPKVSEPSHPFIRLVTVVVILRSDGIVNLLLVSREHYGKEIFSPPKFI